jgi:hypothetical protein
MVFSVLGTLALAFGLLVAPAAASPATTYTSYRLLPRLTITSP